MGEIVQATERVKHKLQPLPAARSSDLYPIDEYELARLFFSHASPGEYVALGARRPPPKKGQPKQSAGAGGDYPRALTAAPVGRLDKALEELARYRPDWTKYIILNTFAERALGRRYNDRLGPHTPRRWLEARQTFLAGLRALQLNVNGYLVGLDDADEVRERLFEILVDKKLVLPHAAIKTGRGLWVGWRIYDAVGDVLPADEDEERRRRLLHVTKGLRSIVRKALLQMTNRKSVDGELVHHLSLSPATWCKLPGTLDTVSGNIVEAFAVGTPFVEDLEPVSLNGLKHSVAKAARTIVHLPGRKDRSKREVKSRRVPHAERRQRLTKRSRAARGARWRKAIAEIRRAVVERGGIRLNVDGPGARENALHYYYNVQHAAAQSRAPDTACDRARATEQAKRCASAFNRKHLHPHLTITEVERQLVPLPAFRDAGDNRIHAFLRNETLARVFFITAELAKRLGLTCVVPGNYREELRQRAVELAAEGVPKTEIARRLGTHRTTVRRWLRASREIAAENPEREVRRGGSLQD